jgi:transcriptional regulator with XRE-family HTH domain
MARSQHRLRDWRRRHRVSLRELAALTGVAESELSRFERGLRCLRPLALIRVARTTGIPIQDLSPEADDAADRQAPG